MSIVMQINPFDFFVDGAGTALDSGYIYIGQPNLDPRQYPVTVYYDEALTIAAAQPLRTSHGYVYRAGAPTFLYIDGNYSVMVQDKNHVQVYYVADALLIGNGSAVSKAELAADNGAELVGYKAPGTNTAKRDVYKKIQKEIELGDYLTGGADDTVQFQNMLADIPNKTTSRLITIGGLQSSFSGTTPRVITRAGDYTISATLNPPAYLRWEGEMAFITMNNPALDMISGLAYQWEMEGFVLIGGRNQMDIFNANINSTMIDLKYVEHFLSAGFAINTRAIGGVWTHLSAEFNIYKSRIMACRQAINNSCDSMTVKNSWIQPSKNNMSPSTAVIVNKGATALDPNALTRLKIQDTFLIPDVGTEGIDRVDNVRWCDNYGSFMADHARFGGESGGMSIVWQAGGYNAAFPWNTTEVILKNSTLFAGPDSRTDSCVLGIQGHVPNRFTIHNCTGPTGRPIISNLSSTDLAAYFAAYEAASGRKAYEYFKVDIEDEIHDTNIYAPLRQMIPNGMYPYLIKGRSTKIRKANQAIPTGLGLATTVSFDTVVDDNLGAFDIGAPTHLNMKNGCSKMEINASVVMASDGAAKTISIDLVDSGGATVDSITAQRAASAEADRMKAVFKVSGSPGAFWTLRIRHNAAGPLNMLDCQVDMAPTDHIV